MSFLERIKDLFAPRPRPPAEPVGEATADRPPPRAEGTTPLEPPTIRMPIREDIAEPMLEPVSEAPRELVSEPTRDRVPEPTHDPADLDELAEVRAALEAVADGSVAAPGLEPEVAPPASGDPIAEPLFPQAPTAATTAPPADTAAADAVDASASADGVEAETHEAPPGVADTRAAAAARTAALGRVGEALVLAVGSPPLTFTVLKTNATLGRGQENTIRLDDLSVSRRHARIAYRQGGYWLSDLGSMGGTWVNGTRLNAPRRLAFGEVIDIGLLRLTVGFAGGSGAAESKKVASKARSQVGGEVRRRR